MDPEAAASTYMHDLFGAAAPTSTIPGHSNDEEGSSDFGDLPCRRAKYFTTFTPAFTATCVIVAAGVALYATAAPTSLDLGELMTQLLRTRLVDVAHLQCRCHTDPTGTGLNHTATPRAH